MYKKNFIDNVLPLFAVVLLIIFQQRQQKNTIELPQNNNLAISETYLDLDEAKIAAEKLGKDILIIIETDWCNNYRRLKKDSLSKIELEDYVVCFLDIENDKEIIKKYNIKLVPYFMIVDKNGNVKKRGNVGFR